MTRITANSVNPLDPNGKLFQRQACIALPILVRQATTAREMTYEQMAIQMEISFPLNLNNVLGSIGVSLQQLSSQWKRDIPPIQSLVVTKSTGLPGDGFADFLPDPAAYRAATRKEKKEQIKQLWHRVRSFRDWPKVLRHFGLKALPPLPLEKILPQSTRRSYGTSGESDAHKDFKKFIANHPEIVGVSRNRILKTKKEYWLVSADRVDVLFKTKGEFVAVEVKAKNAPLSDILRGLFQCVKYHAVLEAEMAVGNKGEAIRTILTLEGALPAELRAYVDQLGITVVESCR